MMDPEQRVSSNNQKASSVQFLTFDDENQIIYNGYCKLKGNTLSKYLHIDPLNEEIKPKSTPFSSQFVKEKHILCIISENISQNLVLIFQHEKLCKKFLDRINKFRDSSNDLPNQEKIIQEQFFIPIFQRLCDSNIVQILNNLFQLYNQQEKQNFIAFLKERGFYDTVTSVLPTQISGILVNARKRRHCEVKRYANYSSENTRSKKKNTPPKKSGLNQKSYQIKIIKKPNYEIVEGIIKGMKRKRLIIFTYDNRKYCEEFFYSTIYNRYFCCPCSNSGKKVVAAVKNDGTEDEYVELLNDDHICEPREYAFLSIFKQRTIIKLPNFEIQRFFRGGVQRNILYIFDGINRNFCYKFIYVKRSDIYICRSCQNKNHGIIAKLRKNENGEEFVEVTGKEAHVCKPRVYNQKDSNNDIELKQSNFKFFPQKTTQSKLFLFDPTNKNMGYEFSHVADDVYQCLGCHLLRDQFKIVKAKLYKNEKGEYCIRMRPNQQHACVMREYDPTKFDERLVYPPNFQFFLSKNGPLNVAIFTSEDKKLCYEFQNKLKNSFAFVCKECKKIAKKSTCANVRKDSNGNECIQLGVSKHICKPVKYSDVLKSGIKLLNSSGLKKETPAKVDEAKIFKEFEFRFNKFGDPKGRLVTICQDDKTQCYEYFYRKGQNRYFCCKCITVSARIITGKDNKQFAQLCQKEHSCQPVQYVPEKPIIREPMFRLFEGKYKRSAKKLIIFTTADHSFCYQYSYDSVRLNYFCQSCFNIDKKRITVKIQTDADAKQYVQQSQLDHVCKPIKFDIKNYV